MAMELNYKKLWVIGYSPRFWLLSQLCFWLGQGCTDAAWDDLSSIPDLGLRWKSFMARH